MDCTRLRRIICLRSSNSMMSAVIRHCWNTLCKPLRTTMQTATETLCTANSLATVSTKSLVVSWIYCTNTNSSRISCSTRFPKIWRPRRLFNSLRKSRALKRLRTVRMYSWSQNLRDFIGRDNTPHLSWRYWLTQHHRLHLPRSGTRSIERWWSRKSWWTCSVVRVGLPSATPARSPSIESSHHSHQLEDPPGNTTITTGTKMSFVR